MLARTAAKGKKIREFLLEKKNEKKITDREEEDGAVDSYGRVLQSRGVDRLFRDLGHPLLRLDLVGKIFRRA